MIDDLVKRLRELANDQDMLAPDNTNDSTELREAADRIETLEAALREIATSQRSDSEQAFMFKMLARTALAGEKKDG